MEDIKAKAHQVCQELKQAGIRADCDDRDNYNPGFKFNYWE